MAKARKGFTKMNVNQLDNKVRRDTTRVKKDLTTLAGDGAAQFDRFADNLSLSTVQAKEDLTKWAEDGISQLGDGFEKLTGDAMETVAATAATVKKDVGRGMSQYNAKVQEVADRVPGGFSEMAARYPWVAITIGIVLGLLLGSLLKPSRQFRG